MYLFNRSISVNVCLVGEKTFKVNGVFLDSLHELCLTLEADLESYTITAAEGELCRAPYTDCGHIKERIKKLAGVDLKRNVRKQVQAIVGLEHGCTHLTDLTLECVKGILQGKFQLMHHRQPEERTVHLEQHLKGTCLHYK
ncbi:MAG: DUF2889 domain-containing protein [Desulfosporosinus sp.]|nr:DUF2889 domain-containing protein [Desulfosporosinus sp.]